MRKIIYRTLPLLLLLFLLTTGSYGQSSVNILRLKKFIAHYETLCNLAPEDTTVINQTTSQFSDLFLNEMIPVYYELDTSAYMKMTVNDYISAMRSFSKKYFIDKIFLYDFKVTRVRKNGIINVQISKKLEYYPRNVDLDLYYVAPVIITNQLFITLFYTEDESYKIIRIDRADHLFVDGLGSSRFIPLSVALEPALLQNSISNDAFEPQQGFKAGWAVALKLNYPLAGKGKFNLLFSPGISMIHINTALEKKNFTQEITGQTDQDGDPYTLLIDGHDLQQTAHIGYLGIPLDLAGIWKFSKTSLTWRAGITFAYPLNASYIIDNADIGYRGQYVFEGYPIMLDNLPQYGYKHYMNDDFTRIDEPDLSLLLLGHTSLTAGFDVSPRITLSLGPEFYFGFNDIINDHSFPAMITDKGSACPNMLSYGKKDVLISWGMNIGIAYNLKRPNVPYIPNTKFSRISDLLYTREAPVYCQNLQTTNIKSTPVNIGFFIENDPKFPGNLNKVPYFFCGVTKANSQKGYIKAGKDVRLTLAVPDDERKRGDVMLRIEKPYGIDIYRYEYQQNPDAPFFELSYSDIRDEKESIMLYARQIPPIDIYYVNNSYKDYEDLNRKEFIDEVEGIINAPDKDGIHELFLYSAYNSDSCAVMRTFSDDKQAIADFLACCYEFYPEGYYNDIDLFKQYLDNIPCNRRDVNLHIVLASPYTYINYITDFIDAVSEYKLESNYSHVKIYIHTPFKKVHIDDAKYDEKLNILKNIYDGMPKSPYIFDYQFEKLFKNK